MVTWEKLSKYLDNFGLLKDFDWSDCKSLNNIDLQSIPEENIIDILDNFISTKIYDDDNSVECKNVKNLPNFEKTIYCAYHYHLERMNDGFMGIFTGYMSPLIFEIKKSLEKINAENHLTLLEKAIKKVNVENKSDNEFLIDIENEDLDWLYDEETEDEYYEYLSGLDLELQDAENIENLIRSFIRKENCR